MTATEFFKLPTNRATVNKLRKSEVFYSNPAFYSEFIKGINSYLSLPKSVKKVTSKVTIESIYDSLVELKEAGYRKELKLEFTK